MGDKLTIPRSFAGKIGTEDVNDSIKRTHAMKLLQVTNSTTGQFLGNSTTAPSLFARNVTLEKVLFSFYLKSTATTGTTLLAFAVMKGASTVYLSTRYNSTAQMASADVWYNVEGTPLITNLTSSDGVWVHLSTNGPAAQIKKLNIWLRFKERVDS